MDGSFSSGFSNGFDIGEEIGAYEFEQGTITVILGAGLTSQSAPSENTEIEEFWQEYFRDIERAQSEFS